MPLSGPTQPVVTPAGGTPAALTTVPGLGSLTAALGGTTLEIPGQFAAFDSEPLDAAVEVVGAPTVADRRRRARRHRPRCSPSSTTSRPGGGTTLPAGPRRAAGADRAVDRPGAADAGAGHAARDRAPVRGRPHDAARRLHHRPGRSRCRPSRRSTPSGRPADGVRARGARGGRPDAGRRRHLPLVGAARRARRARPAGLGGGRAVGPAPAAAGVGRRARRRGRAAALRGREQGLQGRLRRRPRPVLRGAPRPGARPARARTARARRRPCGC